MGNCQSVPTGASRSFVWQRDREGASGDDVKLKQRIFDGTAGCNNGAASNSLRLDDLPIEIILNILLKLPYTGRDVYKHDTFQALRSTSPRIDNIIKQHERSLARRISAEQFPLAHYSLGWTVRCLHDLDSIVRQTDYVHDLLELGRRQLSKLDLSAQSSNEPGWPGLNPWPENWQKFVEIGLWFLQSNGSHSSSISTTARVIEGLPGYALLILRFTSLFFYEVFCINYGHKEPASAALQWLRLDFPQAYGPLFEILSWKCCLAVMIDCTTDISTRLDILTRHLNSMLDNVMVQDRERNRRMAFRMLKLRLVLNITAKMDQFYETELPNLPASRRKLSPQTLHPLLQKRIGHLTVLDVLEQLLPDRREENAAIADALNG